MAKQLLGVFKLPKPLSQMTDEERRAFARSIAEQTPVEALPVKPPPEGERP